MNFSKSGGSGGSHNRAGCWNRVPNLSCCVAALHVCCRQLEVCPDRSCEQPYVRFCVFERRHCLLSMGKIIIALSLQVILLSLSIQTGELLQINGCFNDYISS